MNTHVVEFFDGRDDAELVNVEAFLREGLMRGERCIVVATSVHNGSLVRIFGDRIVAIDAETMLSRFMRGGKPDAKLFDQHVGGAIRRLLIDAKRVRAFGEMVSVLWAREQCDAALELERMWNNLARELPFSLYCSYPINVFSPHFSVKNIDGIMCEHSALQNLRADVLERCVDCAIEDVMGTKAARVRALMQLAPYARWGTLSRGELMLLWLRDNLSEHVDAIVASAQRRYASA
jgi:hypothetical protein